METRGNETYSVILKGQQGFNIKNSKSNDVCCIPVLNDIIAKGEAAKLLKEFVESHKLLTEDRRNLDLLLEDLHRE